MSEILTEGTFCGAGVRSFESFCCGLNGLDEMGGDFLQSHSKGILKNAPKNPQVSEVKSSYSIRVSHHHAFAATIHQDLFDAKVLSGFAWW